jgi:hypothetical protein
MALLPGVAVTAAPGFHSSTEREEASMSDKADAKKAAAAKGNDQTDPKKPEATEPPTADAQPPAETTPEEPKADAKKAAEKTPPKSAGTASARNVIPAKSPAPKSPKPYSADGSKDVKPVAKGVDCVVINKHARCFVLCGVDGPILPGRNTRNTEQVTKAMRNAAARRLGLIIEELGDPEKETQTQKIMNIGNTYDADVLKEIIDTEKDPAVVAAAEAMLKKICPPKEDLEKDGESA